MTLKSSITRERYGSATVGPDEAVVVERVDMSTSYFKYI